ncbi:nitrogenase stabilizing/protective protein NifW [Rhodocista pekingensis]|uniref:Nitrogenase-stabilizing/protective protein NifW n=1 Tax=Rhodocista pekingensis TaxID=201185 RepID=A0ABW2KQP3_9PROT
MRLIDTLMRLSAAEEFFEALAVPYDPAVLRVARLHILRRMGERLSGTDLAALPDAAVRDLARSALEAAYAEFTRTRPIDARVFKVLKAAQLPRGRSFVPLSSLRR